MERVISVPDMHCDACVKRITNALNAASADIVIMSKDAELKFSVSLENKTVTIDGCEHCLKTAVNELEDLGFTPKCL